MTTPTTTEPGVEEALKELREMFLDERVSVTKRQRLLAFPDVRLGVDEEVDYTVVVGKGWNAKGFTESTLSEVMAQARQWAKSQRLEGKS